MALDDADKKTIAEMIGENIKALAQQVTAIGKSVTDGLGAVDAKIKAAVDPLAAKIEQPKPGDKPSDKPKPDDAMPAWAADLNKSVASLAEAVKPVVESHNSSTKERAARELIAKTLKDNKLGGLLKQEPVIKRIVADNPTDAAAVLAKVESLKAEYSSLGLDTKTWGADPAAEGGKPGEGGAKSSTGAAAGWKDRVKELAKS